MSFYERLSAQDASFIGLEDSRCHMHVGGVMLFDAAPLRSGRAAASTSTASARPSRRACIWCRASASGSPTCPTNACRSGWTTTASASPITSATPRCRSRATSACSSGWSVASCRSSSTARGRSGRCGSSKGLEDDRFALISKTHHCMIDGVSGADLISVIMEPFPNPEPGEPMPWTPRPHPSDARLLFDEAAAPHRAAARRRARGAAPRSAIPSRRSAKVEETRRGAGRGVLADAASGLAAADQHRGRPVAALRLDRDVGRRPQGGEEGPRRHAERRRAGDGERRAAPLLPAARGRSRHAGRARAWCR